MDGTRILAFYCPGCEEYHSFLVDRPAGVHPAWTMSGTENRPTFTPSLLYPDRVCHLFVRDGMIQYLGDCTHKLAGQTVEMEDAE